jgi:hypothetical protein
MNSRPEGLNSVPEGLEVGEASTLGALDAEGAPQEEAQEEAQEDAQDERTLQRFSTLEKGKGQLSGSEEDLPTQAGSGEMLEPRGSLFEGGGSLFEGLHVAYPGPHVELNPLLSSASLQPTSATSASELGSLELAKALAEAELIKQFFDESASQLTYHGLVTLHEEIAEERLCVFYRNYHFNTIYRYQNKLYLLVTDMGYLSEPKIVWELLSEVGNLYT